jgi:glucosamine--fructose-6-phosphate aminotransferase (isomerizing)
MCGIIGMVSRNLAAAPIILEGLKKLEYRGYDSAGIATVDAGRITKRKAEGKIINLEQHLASSPLSGALGIGHTRWATHGMPSERNAHPHATDRVAVVHNGIIENYSEIRAQMEAAGFTFKSDTDSEVVPVLITHLLKQGKTPKDAVFEAIKQLHGAYALAIMIPDAEGTLYAARHGAPLALGYGKELMMIGSDALALAGVADEIAYLEDGDIAAITAESAAIWTMDGKPAERLRHALAYSSAATGKGNYRHYMQKEIFEQPAAVADTLSSYYNPATQTIHLPLGGLDLAKISRIRLVACGTSYFSALAASYWLEQIAKIPTQVDIASEFRYREPILDKDGVSIVISQSGETADTLAALKYITPHQPCIAIVNVPMSSIARAATHTVYTHAGPEIGVASTKAFTTQLVALACITLAIAKARGAVSDAELKTHIHALLEAPALMSELLHAESKLQAIAERLAVARDVLYLGRGTSYAIAHEGALKLKEISYIHAEAYAAGEMKHGPIALIDEHVPIIALAPSDVLFDKTASNLQEAAARGGKIILFSDEKGVAALEKLAAETFAVPASDPFVTPLLYALPVQLLAYHTAVLKGTDVDQPRNLAKSVTVE